MDQTERIRELRTRTRLLSIKESAELLGYRPVAVYRASALGYIGFFRDASGKQLLPETDAYTLLQMSEALTMPPNDGEWFIAERGIPNRNELIPQLRQHGRSVFTQKHFGKTFAHQFAIGELRALARVAVGREQSNSLAEGQATPLERLYSRGPDAFRAFTKRLQTSLGRSVVKAGDSEFRLANVLRHADILSATKEAF